MENVNDTYFDGYYKDIWKTIIPDELTVKEVDFMIQYFNLQPGNKVLDLMCGYGRHSLSLAKKGISTTAVDNLSDYINEIKKTAELEKLPVVAIVDSAINYKPTDTFDLAICMGNSLNFFNADDTLKIMKMVAGCLKPGGHFFINTWSLLEIIAKGFKQREWSKEGDLKFLVECKFLFHPTRMEAEHIIIAPDNNTETKKAVDYIFSVSEMESMLAEAGFVLNEIYSVPGKKKFALGDPRAYIVAEKKK